MMSRLTLVLPLIVLSLLLGIWLGLIRIGFNLPLNEASAHHGSLMVNCFLASLVFLERAVTFRNKWILLLPFINAFSFILFLAGYAQIALGLNIIASAGFLIMCGWFIYQYKELYYYVFFAGALSLLGGNIILLKSALYPAAVMFWMQFLLFTIVAERLELSRFLPVKTRSHIILIAILSLAFISSFLSFHNSGSIVFSISLTLTSLWLMRNDMAFKSAKMQGHHRYSGVLLITGYMWLMVTAAIMLVWQKISFGYDAMLHSFFIGFVFSMIFSHAPVILPAVIKMPLKVYRPILYAWFILMQLSLIIRMIADIISLPGLRKYAGLTNGVSIVIFLVTIGFIAGVEWRKIKKRSAKT